jgi:outer membrane protein OmpA-like peptidoglycan-associated protein
MNLQLCSGKYRVIPRLKYDRHLEELTFDETKSFLKKGGIDYFVYGDVFHDETTKHFTIKYILEEALTGSILFIETIHFEHISDLVNINFRQETIKNQLKKEEELCKHFSEEGKMPVVIDEATQQKMRTLEMLEIDADSDGISDIVDKDLTTPINASVDKRGVQDLAKSVATREEIAEELIFNILPDLPEIAFEDGISDFNDQSYLHLNQIARFMKEYPAMVVRLEGIDAINENLATERAIKIKEFLVSNYRLSEKKFIIVSKIQAEAKSKVIVAFAK